MNRIIRFLQFGFLPHSIDAGLLVLRLWLGLSLFYLHGWVKLTGYSQMLGKFPDPLGVGVPLSLSLTIFAEVGCGLLLALGLFTRLAAFVLAFTMTVAFFLVHKASLEAGPGSGELAYIYLAGFVTVLIAGPGRFSVDARLAGQKR